MIKPVLVPKPKSVKLSEDFFVISSDDTKMLDLYIRDAELPSCIRVINLSGDNSESIEHYRLEVTPAEIIITAAAPGKYYAVQTLKQLIKQSRNNKINCCIIEDKPDFPVRLVHFDVSRNRIPRMEMLKALIDRFASWKYNQFQLYIEHTFAYRNHRQVWKDSSPLTPEEVKELNNYCADRFIELVPNQNSFGHMERWLMHDDYKHLAESPEGFEDPWGIFREHSSTLAPAAEETFSFLSELYDELLPCFDSEYLNVGGDEPYELGKGRSRELCEGVGLDRLYLNFLLKLRELAAEKGKRIQIYGDIIMKYPHLIKELPKDIILVTWGYEANHPFEEECRQISASEIPFYVCTGVSSWNSIGGRWMNTMHNIRNGAMNALRFGAEGFLVSEWGDNGHLQQSSVGLPGFLYGAAAAWNVEGLEGFEIERTSAIYIFDGSAELAEAAMKLQNLWECSGVALHNVSLPAVLLLDPGYPYYREDYKQFRGYNFEDEIRMISEAEELLAEAPDSMFRDELRFTAALLRHGCNLGKLQFLTDDLTISSIAEDDRIKLADELEPLIKEFSRLWLLTSREGGLEASLDIFHKLSDLYKK